MRIIVEDNYDKLSEKAAQIVAQKIRENPRIVLGLATGVTTIGLYKELGRMYKEEGLDFANVTTFNLDEYVGLAPDHPQSYNFAMNENLFYKINIPETNIFIPYGPVRNIEKHCQWYEKIIQEKGGIDFQIIGIGGNGHIGFNEPGSSFDSVTRVVDLDKKTIKDNARFFDSINDVPKQAMTMGISTIMNAKECFLLASGEHKAEIIEKALKGPVTTDVPASILQNHPNLIVILDKTAAKQN